MESAVLDIVNPSVCPFVTRWQWHCVKNVDYPTVKTA